MKTETIDNSLDFIDSRDVIARIEYLQGTDDADEKEELSSLIALAEEGADYAPDWEYGVTLIRDDYFATYAQELAEDIGAVDSAATWPNNCIDWDRAARELQYDYSSIEFNGVTYWVRS